MEKQYGVALTILAMTVGCPEVPSDGVLQEAERSCRADWAAGEVVVSGRLTDRDGGAVVGTVDGVSSGIDGAFTTTLSRGNALLTIVVEEFHTEIVAVDTSMGDVELGAIVLARQDNNRRLLFGGDTMLGRRYYDPEGVADRDEMPSDNPDAFLLVSDPGPGSTRVLAGLRPYFQAADFGSLNFESVVTTDPSTSNDETSIAFFSLPGSLPSLVDLGVDYVSLGNNHSYDYLDPGIVSSSDAFDDVGIAHSGTGLDADEAYTSTVVDVFGESYAFVSMSGIDGSSSSIPLVASDDRGGSADLNDEDRAVQAVLDAGQGGLPTIVQLHDGVEYAETPLSRTSERSALMARAGAALVVGHHPHVVRGFRRLDGVLVAESLGNVVFDSERHETMQSYLLATDLVDGQVQHAQIAPLYIEDWFPRPMVGSAASRLIRQVGAVSSPHGVSVTAGPFGAALGWDADVATTEREVSVDVVVGEDRVAVVDLRSVLANGESLAHVRTDVELATVDVGRDLLYYGGFEDIDVDEDVGETTAWTYGTASEPCHCDVLAGAQSLCSFRDDSNLDEAVVTLRRRVRVEGFATDRPVTDVGLVVWSSAINGGETNVVARFSGVRGSDETEDLVAVSFDRGDRDWSMAYASLDLLAAQLELEDPARAMRLLLRSAPPRRGDGVVRFDQVGLVSWGEQDLRIDGGGQTFGWPNSVDFLRVSAAPGTHTLTLSVAQAGPIL